MNERENMRMRTTETDHGSKCYFFEIFELKAIGYVSPQILWRGLAQ
jgi:hypothetical protein